MGFIVPVLVLGSCFFHGPVAAVDAQTQFSKAGLLADEVISMEELRNKQIRNERFVLFDARTKQSYDEGHIQGARLPLSADYYKKQELFRMRVLSRMPDMDKELVKSVKAFPKDKAIVTYCNDKCQASAVLALKLKSLGFKSVRAMEGGFQSWKKKGYPVE